MNYDEYRYLWPPRPENAIPKEMISFYENRGWIAQLKKNGTCTPIFARGLEVIFKTRHNDDHKQWSPLPGHVHAFQTSSKWNVFVAELIHNKTKGVKNKIYVFDKIVHEGVFLGGMTFAERYKLLSQFKATEDVVVAKNFNSGFSQLMQNLQEDDEGLVFKDPNSVLEICKETSNRKWQVKCRKPHKNYSF